MIIPEEFITDTVIREGAAGREWIDRLPIIIESLCREWNLEVEGEPMHGYLGLVVPVRRGDEPCVLKVSWKDEATPIEARALSVWNGNGAVRLLAANAEQGAMLLERLNSRRSLNDVGMEEAVLLAGRLLRRLSVPATDGFPRLKTVAERLSESFPERWERLGQPMPRRRLDRARDLALQLGSSAADLMVNWDLHYDNVLAGDREPWLAIDPKIVVGDPEYGIAQLFWCRLEEMIAQGGLERHFRILTEAAELDPELARSWTVVRCVDYWLWGLSIGLTEDPVKCRIITDWLVC